MSFIDSISDYLHYENRKDYTVRVGNITYLDTSPLSRPFNMPLAQRSILIGVLVAAVIIGLVWFNNTALEAIRESNARMESIESNLQRPGALEALPSMTQIASKDANGILSSFQEAGYQIYDATAPNDEGDIAVYRIPGDMNYDEAAALFAKGIAGLDAADATKLLNGMWYFETDNANGTKVIRFADFSTADPQVAVRNALSKQEFSQDSISESGVDDSGNTYSMGSFDADGGSYTWKVSALPLSDMYSISGLPENACYVGIRVTRA